jgi:hypothetical protein
MKTLTLKIAILLCCVTMPCAYAHPPERLVEGHGEKAARSLDRTLKPLIAKAKATFPQAKKRFLAGLPAGEKFYVLTRLYGENGAKTEDVYVVVREMTGGEIRGVIDSDVLLVKTYRKGQLLAFPEAKLIDWSILHRNGYEEGNVVGRHFDSLLN